MARGAGVCYFSRPDPKFVDLLPVIRRMTSRLLHIALVTLVAAAGCTSGPFAQKERTSVITPAMRIAAIREGAARTHDADTAEQAKAVDELVTQIRTERDPIVRKAIQEAVAEYDVPMARQVLIAGLNDEDLDVRLACCYRLGTRGEPEAVPALRKILEDDGTLDVRLAAADALGKINTPESIEALSIAVKDRDPALQYAGVEALKNISGQDLGNDVKVWQQFTEQPTSVAEPKVSVADRVRQLSPF